MTSLPGRVQQTIVRHSLLLPDQRVLIGVSGGADSVALLLILKELGYGVAVAHLNHGLRGEDSDADEGFVEALALEIGAPYFARRVSIADQGGNIEAAGRLARKEFFRSVMQQEGFSRIALAHNQQDRVETFLLHLLRGAGSEGLVSMAPRSENTVRPLLETPRAEIENYLQKLGRPWRTDHTNSDISFARNRMRHEVMPQLASLFNVRLVETLSRTIALLQDEDQWMDSLVVAWLSENCRDSGLDAAALGKVPVAMARRVIRGSLRLAGSTLHDLSFDHVEAVRSLLEDGKSGKTISLPGGFIAAREFDRLVFLHPLSSAPEFDYSLPIPGRIHIPELGKVVCAEIVSNATTTMGLAESPDRVFVDGSHLGACVKIRNWKPGDYYRPVGWPAGKLKKLFQRARVPRSQRHRWPVFVNDSTIVWVASFPVSREFIPSEGSKKIVAFETLQD